MKLPKQRGHVAAVGGDFAVEGPDIDLSCEGLEGDL